ncbi:MAG: alpha-L-glutamate ligase-like protein, partial [Planctomycetota bacterium]|nr:alpha-L-glutamate ligase-like protein [Planctomycetota bacterium]
MARSTTRFWAWPWELARAGVLGINCRNAAHVLPMNPRSNYPRVDDKLLTKEICEVRGIPVPATYAAIERHGDIRNFLDLAGRRQEFVIKPASGSAGRGIIIVAGHDGATFATSGGVT